MFSQGAVTHNNYSVQSKYNYHYGKSINKTHVQFEVFPCTYEWMRHWVNLPKLPSQNWVDIVTSYEYMSNGGNQSYSINARNLCMTHI